MSATGCGYPTPFAGETFPCGTRLVGFGDLAPILCPACEQARQASQAPRTATCEGCREAPATRTRPPFLCHTCEAEYASDMAALGYAEPGSRCSAACGHCGRCGA